jgi:hypothetical protein
MSGIDFLSLDDLLFAHADQIQRYGGDPGVRDLGLLESAMAQPQATFGGQWLHSFPFEMAARQKRQGQSWGWSVGVLHSTDSESACEMTGILTASFEIAHSSFHRVTFRQ